MQGYKSREHKGLLFPPQSGWLIQSVFSKSMLVCVLGQSTLNFATCAPSPWASCDSFHTCVNNVVLMQPAVCLKGSLALTA